MKMKKGFVPEVVVHTVPGGGDRVIAERLGRLYAESIGRRLEAERISPEDKLRVIARFKDDADSRKRS